MYYSPPPQPYYYWPCNCGCRHTYPAYPTGFHDSRQYPEVDPELFIQSAEEFKSLMEDAATILDKLSESEEFAYQIMSAAQQNNKGEVQRLIDTTGVESNVEVDYNPDNLKLMMSSEVEQTECCQLEMAIRWRTFP